MNYAFETVSVAVMCIPSFINIGSGIQKLIGWGMYIKQAHRQQSDLE
jgi:hypothetical protein